MDHSFSITGAIRQHHHHHQQSVRNSLSPSPALNNYYRISPSPTNANILTASAAPTGISGLSYNSNKTSPTPTGYQTASPQTVINTGNVSNLYRVQTLTVQQQQQQQYIQQIQPQIHHSPSSFVHPSAGATEQTSYNQARVAPTQYPLRQQNSGNLVSHRNAIQIPANPQTLASSYSPSNSSSRVQSNSNYSTADNNFRNLQQPHQPLSSHAHTRHQPFQHIQHSQPQQQYQPIVSQKSPTPTQSQQQQAPPNPPQNMNKNNRFLNTHSQPQAAISSNGVNSSNPTAHIHQSQQPQQINQNQPQSQSQLNTNTTNNSMNNNSAPGAPNSGKCSPPQVQQQQQPQYRIFKRGDSIPGISSPIHITAQVTGNSNDNSGTQQQNESGSSSTYNENWDNSGEGNGSEAMDNQNGNKENKENSTCSPKSSNDMKGINASAIRTPLSQIGEIARFHSIQVEYRLVKETGPPHAPTFTVVLHLGNEEYTGEGPSIKKAQHAAAVEALEKTALSRPPPKSKPKKSFNHGGAGGGNKRPNWALIQLTNLVQELQLPLQFVQQPVQIVDPFRRGEPPSIVSVHVGERIFTGEGSNFNSAKNMAVMIALKAMVKVKQEMDLAKLAQAGADAEQSMMDADNKSPISIVHEMAMKRSLTVVFDIVQETGPPHMKVFTVKCKVGEDLETEGQGPTKQAAKKSSSESMIAKLKEIPIQLPASSQGINIKAMQRGLMRQKLAKKKTSTPVVKDLEKQTVSPISRLIQICHIKKLKEPEFILISTGTETNVENFLKQITERDRRMLRKKKPVFTIEVTVATHTCRGTGPNKKAAKKAAAEAAILALGYGPTEGCTEDDEDNSSGPTTKDIEKVPNNINTISVGKGASTGNKGNNASQVDGKSGNSGNTGGPTSVKLAGARQIAPGIIVLKQESTGTGGTTSITAAQEMKKVNTITTSTSSTGAHSSREGIEKLAYLSKLLDISVSYSDFPKKNEYLSVVSLTTNPPHVAHGCGATLEEAQNAAALKILEELSTMDLDTVTAAAEKPTE